jgi:hypothetical protein
MHQVTLPTGQAIDLPTRWGKLTLGQFVRLAELPEQSDVYNFLSVFLNLSPLEVMNLPAAFVNEQVLPVLDFAAGTVPDFASFTRPPYLHLPGETPLTARALKTLDSLDIITFGQATDLGALLQDATMPVLQKRLRALAIVFYPAYVSGDYDSDAITAFAEKVCSQALLEEVLPITDFFLTNTTSSAAATPANSSAFPSPETRKLPASKPWWKSGMRWLWSTRWPLVTKRSGATSGASAGAKSTR